MIKTKININFLEKDKEFAQLIAESISLLISKNDNIEYQFTYNETGEKTIVINDLKLVNKDASQIIISTSESEKSIHQLPEIPFYYIDNDGEVKPLIDNNKKLFWLKIYDLFTALNINNKSKYIYIAPCSTAQNSNREILIRQFVREGFEILPHNNLKQSKESVYEDLAKADFSVHILDEHFGKNDSLAEYFNDIAAGYIKEKYSNQQIKNILRFVWISPELNFYDENQKLNIEKFRQDSEGLMGAEILQTPIELFKTLIQQRILEVAHDPNNRANQTNLYLIHEKQDNLKDLLKIFENNSIHVDQLTFGEDLVKEHRQKLVNADNVLIYGLKKNNNWIKSKTKDILKAPGFGKLTPFNNVVLMVDNIKNYKEDNIPVTLIEDNTSALDLFIKKMKN